MKIVKTSLDGVLIIEPTVFTDERGYFFESFNKRKLEDAVESEVNFVQDNQSMSHKNVLRGLHYQVPPCAQAKLVRAVVGQIFDVAVDIRRGSEKFGKWVGVELSSDNQRQLFIPEGFAHGFLTMSEKALVSYKTDAFYNAESERSIIWDDATLNIDWPISSTPIISAKDCVAPPFTVAELF